MNTSQTRSAGRGSVGVEEVANFHQLTLDVADNQTAHQDLSGWAARMARADSCKHRSKEYHAGCQFIGGLFWLPFVRHLVPETQGTHGRMDVDNFQETGARHKAW